MFSQIRSTGAAIAVTAAALLSTPSASFAQHGGHGGGGGSHGGGTSFHGGGAVRGGGGYGGYRGIGGGYGGFRGGFGGGYGGYGGFGVGGFYGAYPYAPFYDAPTPYPIYNYSPSPYSGYSMATPVAPALAGTTFASNANQNATVGSVQVTVPAAARVWFDGSLTTTAGAIREYQTPPLTAGQRYSYEIKAVWQQDGREMSQTQTVSVTAGQPARVVFPAPAVASGPTATAAK